MSKDVGWAGLSKEDHDQIEGPRKVVLFVSSIALALLVLQKLKTKR
jgi:hypothetical protein